MLTRHGTPRRQRGLTLVELMVGIAVGLFVVAAAAMLVSTQLNDNRRLLLETQLQQDLRAATDIVTRELRRAGYWTQAELGVWSPTASPLPNPFAAVAPADEAAGQVDFQYMRRPGEQGPFGFRRDGTVVRTLLAAGGWQELTDGSVLRVTRFEVTPRHAPPVTIACPRLCADGTTDCWPSFVMREFEVAIEGEAVADPQVRRSLRTLVRLRNDEVRFNDALNPNRMCPE